MTIAEFFQFGVPTVLLVGLAIYLWRALSWFAVNIAIPLRDRHFAYLEMQEKQMDALVLANVQQTSLLKAMNDSKTRHMELMERIYAGTQETGLMVAEIHQHMKIISSRRQDRRTQVRPGNGSDVGNPPTS